MKLIQELDNTNFKDFISGTDKPILVDFWAPWCGPCKTIAPMLDELAQELGDSAKICKVNIDQNSELATKYNIRAIPTMVIIKNSQTVDTIVGLANKSVIKAKLEAQA